MSFGEGVPINYGQRVSNTEVINLAGSVQTALQGRFDTNVAKIDEMVSKVSSIPLEREKDKQYLHERVNGLLNSVNAQLKVGGGSALLSNSVSTEVGRYISTAIDENVIKQMGNTQSKIQFDKAMAQKQKDGKGLYDDDNYAFALEEAGYAKWKKGETDDLGTLSYTDYRDVMGNAMKKAKEFKDLKGDQTIEIPDGRGGKTVTTIKGLTPQEIMDNIPGFITPEDDKQLVIDGWKKYRGNVQAAQTDFESMANSKKALLDDRIKENQAIIDSSTDPTSVTRAKDLKAQYEKRKEELVKGYEAADKTNIKQMGYALQKEGLVDTMSHMFSGRISSVQDVDDFYFKDREDKRAEIKLGMDAEEHAMKMKAGVKGTKTKADGTLEVTPEAFAVGAEANQEVTAPDFYQGAKEGYNDSYNKIIAAGESAYNDQTTSKPIKDRYLSSLRANGYDVVNGKTVPLAGYKGTVYSKAGVVERAFRESDMDLEPQHSSLSKVIGAESEKRRIVGSALIQAEKNIKEDFNTDKFVDDFKNVKSLITRWSPARALDFTSGEGGFGAIFSPITDTWRENEKGNTPEAQKRMDIAAKIDNFIKVNGGEAALKKKVLNNPSLLNQMKTIMDEASDTDANVSRLDYGDPSQVGQKVGESLKAYGIAPYVKQKQTAMVVDEDVKKAIISRIVPEAGAPKLDPNSGMMIREVADGFEISQDTGISETKDGVTSKAPIKRVVPKGSAAYDIISQGLTTEMPSTLDARGVPDSTVISNIKQPRFLEQDAVTIDKFKINYTKDITDANIKAQNLHNYFTARDTKDRVYAELGGKHTPAEISAMVDRINSGFSKNEYKVQIIPNNKAKWAVKLHKGNTYFPATNISDGAELSDDYRDIVQKYPQLMVMNEIVNLIKSGKANINNF